MMAILKQIFCFLTTHKYRVVQYFSAQSRRVYCDRCHSDWGMNDDARALIPWDWELAQMYRNHGHRIVEP